MLGVTCDCNCQWLVDYVRKINSDDELWCRMISRLWMTPAQKSNMERSSTQYHRSMDDLLAGNVEGKRRSPTGKHQNLRHSARSLHGV